VYGLIFFGYLLYFTHATLNPAAPTFSASSDSMRSKVDIAATCRYISSTIAGQANPPLCGASIYTATMGAQSAPGSGDRAGRCASLPPAPGGCCPARSSDPKGTFISIY